PAVRRRQRARPASRAAGPQEGITLNSKAKPRFPSRQAIPAQPARNEQQFFAFGPFVFDVEEAHAVIRQAPRPKFQIDAEAWALNYGIAYIQPDGTTPADAPTLIRQADG